MATAYVVLSHTEVGQVVRLVHSILRSSRDARVFVMHDGRRAPAPVIDDARVQVRSHGRPTDWGSWDLVEVTLQAMRWAREEVDPDLLVVLSGQCYPARRLGDWEQELMAAGGGWQGTARRLSYIPAWGRRSGTGDEDLTRYTFRWFRVGLVDKALRANGLTARIMVAGARWVEPVVSLRQVWRGRGAHVGVRRLSPIRGHVDSIYLGSQWLAVDRKLLETVLAELSEGTRLRRLYEHSIIPDESAIQTVLARVQSPTVAVPTSYCVWEPDRDETRTLTLADLEDIEASYSPFCRKVDPVQSAALIQALDRLNGGE